MASLRLLRPLSIGLTASAVLATPLLARPSSLYAYCDDSKHASTSPRDWSFSQYSRDAQTPVVRKGGVNPRIYRQISSGSIIGTFRLSGASGSPLSLL